MLAEFRKKAGLSGLFCSVLAFAALTAAASTAANAAPVTLKVENASVADDARTHQLVLEISVHPAARAALRRFSEDHIGRKFVLRIDGKAYMTSTIREPLLGGTIQISGASPDAMRAALNQISSGRDEIVFDDAPD